MNQIHQDITVLFIFICDSFVSFYRNCYNQHENTEKSMIIAVITKQTGLLFLEIRITIQVLYTSIDRFIKINILHIFGRQLRLDD